MVMGSRKAEPRGAGGLGKGGAGRLWARESRRTGPGEQPHWGKGVAGGLRQGN